MKAHIKSILAVVIVILASPTLAYSAAEVTIDTVTEKMEVIDAKGVQLTRFVESSNVTPGDTLRFTLQFKNTGDATAENVVLDNPLPPNSLYIADSATSYLNSTPKFSIDDGLTFSAASALTYQAKNPDGSSETVVAPPQKYTHIRWQLPPLAAGAAGQVSFNVLIQ